MAPTLVTAATPKWTDSRPAAILNLERARYFLKIHDKAHKKSGHPTREYLELPRAAVVFAVGALDAYLSDVSAEVLIEQLQRASSGANSEVLKILQRELPSLALEVALIESHSARVARLRDVLVNHFQESTSNHGSKAVSAAVLRMGGKPADLWSSLTGPGKKSLAETLDYWTNVRHAIVHKGENVGVQKKRARDFITSVETLVAAVDRIAYTAKQAPKVAKP